MALYDVDKTSNDRSNPQPNTHDLGFSSSSPILDAPRQAHQTDSTTYKTDTSKNRIQQQNQRILAVDSNNVPVVSLGLQVDGTVGMRVAKSGVNVTTNTDASQLIFNSAQDVFKIVKSGTISVTAADPLALGTATTVTVPHGLSYTPAYIGFFTGLSATYSYLPANTFYPIPFIVHIVVGGVPEPVEFYLTTDATNITAVVRNDGGVGIAGLGTATFKYYLLQETAT